MGIDRLGIKISSIINSSFLNYSAAATACNERIWKGSNKVKEVVTFFFTEGNSLKQYAIHHRLGRGTPTGASYTDRNGRLKYKTEFKEYYETDAGTFEPDEWKSLVSQAVAEEGKTELLGQIMEHCRKLAWLHKESEIEDYALEVLCSEAYMHWDDFRGKEHGS